jgi:alkanesulfonate monooxygenase SsuD/methylene tetrahydromethanopterin reductase-like flavin-dependent oxidoreductase (luciferase family)
MWALLWHKIGRLQRLVEQIEYADQIRLDVFGIGEHHRREFLDSAPAVILAAAVRELNESVLPVQ